ncbi:hypothetical protein QWJ34_11690 [Saccharibacillus sp. CPCC 101409]|uniref:hypothetical protein n=1 Tax=Saccharibacillus sp. CPCC 101409 TaxID=3058041 RepID=UPI002673246E|nr:hypothetical protein [Saccharibacillus sp. CPCC 101409]MDO3410425.1 hypothetical protein [Saccharibacillus sp. CPCC 101409]
MKKKTWKLGVLAALGALALSGCGRSLTAEQAVPEAYGKLTSADSFAFESSTQIQVSSEGIDAGGTGMLAAPAAALANGTLNLSINGAYDKALGELEAELSLASTGEDGTELKINSVLIVADGKAYIKIPDTLATLVGAPQFAGKFYQPNINMAIPLQTEDINGLAEDILRVAAQEYDGSILINAGSKSARVPEGVKADSVARLELKEKDLEPVFRKAVREVAPRIVDDVLGGKEWKDKLQITDEDLEEMHASLDNTSDESIESAAKRITDAADIRKAVLDLGTNRDGLPQYGRLSMDFDIMNGTDTAQPVSVQIEGTTVFKNYNGTQTFNYSIPSGDEVIPGGF